MIKRRVVIISFFMLLLVGLFTYMVIRPTNCLKVTTFKSGMGWGYDIKCDEKIFIHQTIVPGISGNYCFKTQAHALKTGKLVVNRIRKKEIPSITNEDLINLRVEYIEISQSQ